MRMLGMLGASLPPVPAAILLHTPASSADCPGCFAGALPDLLYLTLHNWMGPASFVVFAGVAFFGCGYCHLHLPETKGRTLAEVQALLAKKGTAATSAADHAVSEASSLAAASGLGSGHEQMMRPNGEAAPSAAIGGRALPQSVAAGVVPLHALCRCTQFTVD